MSIQYTVPGFNPTTSWTWVDRNLDQGSRPVFTQLNIDVKWYSLKQEQSTDRRKNSDWHLEKIKKRSDSFLKNV